jgi:hypothetical protein
MILRAQKYFYNRDTGVSSWKPPKAAAATAALTTTDVAPMGAATTGSALPAGWEVDYDQDGDVRACAPAPPTCLCY